MQEHAISIASLSCQAGSWDKKRRVVAKVEWHPGEFTPDSASSSPTCLDLPNELRRFTITVARRLKIRL